MHQVIAPRRTNSVAWLTLMLLVVVIASSAALERVEQLILDDFLGISRWSQSGWADADVDPAGLVRYVPRIVNGLGPDGEGALSATLHFKPGGYSQGVVLQSNPGDWSKWDQLVVELKLVEDIPDLTVHAKIIIFPEDRWTEAADAYSATLVPGEWVTLRLPLGDAMPSDLWSAPTDATHLARNRAWAVKLYAINVPEASEPVQVLIARPRLERSAPSDQADGDATAARASDGITVSTSFRVAGNASGERIEVAGLVPAASPSSARVSLTLTLKPGLFGPAPALRLESRPQNFFPEHLRPVEAIDAAGAYHFVEIWSANALSTRVPYEATLSLSEQMGVLSVSFGPKDGDRLVEGYLLLKDVYEFDTFLPANRSGDDLNDVRDGNGRDASGLIIDARSVRDGAVVSGTPFGFPEDVAMRIASLHDARPFTWIAKAELRQANADHPLRVAFRGIDAGLPVTLRLWVDEEAGRQTLWMGDPPEDGEVTLPAGALSPGRHTLGLTVEDRFTAVDLAKAEIEVTRAHLQLAAHVTGYRPGAQRFVVEFEALADQPISGLELELRTGSGERWTGNLSLRPGEPTIVPLEIAADERFSDRLEITKIPFIEHPGEISIQWSEEGLAAYLNGLRPVDSSLATSGPLTRGQLAAVLRRWLGLAYHEKARISSDTALVDARREALRDGHSSSDDVQALLQVGLLPALLLDADRYAGERHATWGDALTLLVRAGELATGALYRTPNSARPRSTGEYIAAVEPTCLPSSFDVDLEVVWDDLVSAAACVLQGVGVGELLTAGLSGGRYVLPGTESYRPDQRRSSVGIFGLWSRGEDVRAKGWLGDERQRGLLAFSLRPLGSSGGSRAGFDLYWHRFNPDGSDLTFGRLEFEGEVSGLGYSVLDSTTARWDIAANGGEAHTQIFLSRAFPAALAVTESDQVAWRLDARELVIDELVYLGDEGRPASTALESGVAVVVPGKELAGPWLLVRQRIVATGEQVPVLIRLEERPERITVERGSLALRFNNAAGAVSVMPLYGIRRLSTGSSSDDAGRHVAVSESDLALVEFWSRALADFPIGLTERYEVNEDAKVVHVEARYSFHQVHDAWGTVPLEIAPVPPVIALAEAAGYPVQWSNETRRSETATFLGPFAYQQGTTARYALPIYPAIDQVSVPVRVSGDPALEALAAQALQHVDARWFPWPSVTLDNTLLAAHARAYALVEDAEARAWYKDRIAQSLAELYDERNLDTVVQPANGQSYVYNNRIWAAGEDFDREYYIGRQLVVTGETAQWVGWDVVRPYWDAIRGLYAYYQIHWDWAWQGSTTFQTGFSFQADGVVLAWEGIMNMARMAQLAGDELLANDARYRAAALGASLFALWELTGWAMENDYAVMHPGHANEPPRRRPPQEILTGFLPDTYSEYTGVVTTMPTEWGASNWLHDDLPGRTRFFNDFRFAEVYDWQMRVVPRLYPELRDRYNVESHLRMRSLLYGKDPALEAAIVAIGPGPSSSPWRLQSPMLRSLVPQVWVSASTARLTRNMWDAERQRLLSEIEAVRDGTVTYDWAWRSMEQIDAASPAPHPGPTPSLVRVNGRAVEPALIQGGWWRIVIPVAAGDHVLIETTY